MDRNPVAHSFVGLDMSLTGTGICIKGVKDITVETLKTTPRTKPNDIERLEYIVDETMSRIPKNTSLICIEDYFTPRNSAQIGSAIKLVSLGTVMRRALYKAGLGFYVVSPNQLKKFVSGKGNMQKSLILREVYKKWDIDCKDDNQADGAVLAHIAEAIWIMDRIEKAKEGSLPAWNGSSLDDLPQYQIETARKIYKTRPCYNV